MRRNFKTKNFNPNNNPLLDSSSSEDEENETQVVDQNLTVEEDFSPIGKRLDSTEDISFYDQRRDLSTSRLINQSQLRDNRDSKSAYPKPRRS